MTNQTLTQNTNPTQKPNQTKTNPYETGECLHFAPSPYENILTNLRQQLSYNISYTQSTIKLHKHAIHCLNHPQNQNKPTILNELKKDIQNYISEVKQLHRERFFLQNQIHNYSNLLEYINKINNTNI
jgi:hypothetical protein